MAFIKKNWLYLAMAVIAVGSIATAAWAYFAGDSIIEQLQSLDRLRNDVQKEAAGAQNAATIEAKKAEQARLNAEQEAVLKSALHPQMYNAFEGRERQLLVPEALPTPKSNATRIEFRDAYRRAFRELARYLHGRGPATPEEVTREQTIQDSKSQSASSDQNRGPWMPEAPKETESDAANPAQKERSIQEILSNYAKARAAELAARSCYIYIDPRAFAPHEMWDNDDVPTAMAIWHAQMTLWIQQDIAYAINRLNERRAEQLKKDGRPYDCWVGNMPVKHLKLLAGEDWLGRGGGMSTAQFATSFTGTSNDTTKFIVPLFLDVVVEEAALPDLIDSLTRTGYYTPTRVEYAAVERNPLQDEFIYGEAPSLEVKIDLEAVYFRKVYDAWIPKELANILSRPGAKEDPNTRR